jgi:uncharacterized protein
MIKRIFLIGVMGSLFFAFTAFSLSAQLGKPTNFRALVLYENGGHHIDFSHRAMVWLDQLAVDSNFAIDYIQNTDKIDKGFLVNYQLFIQLDYAPYAWKPAAVTAFQEYIESGQGGWIGFHHATLLGEFDGYPIWPGICKRGCKGGRPGASGDERCASHIHYPERRVVYL